MGVAAVLLGSQLALLLWFEDVVTVVVAVAEAAEELAVVANAVAPLPETVGVDVADMLETVVERLEGCCWWWW